MTVELLNSSHLKQLLDIEKRVFPTDAWTRRDFTYFLSYRYSYGIFREGQLAGYIMAEPEGSTFHLGNMAVDFPFRRDGIGRVLLRHAEQIATKHMYRRLVLETRVSNLPAITLYESEGYHRVGLETEYYIDNNEDALIFIKELGNVPLV